MNIYKWNSNDWLDKIKTWCYEEPVLSNLTLSQQAKLATRLSFFFMSKNITFERTEGE